MSSASSLHRTLPTSLGDWKLLAKKWNATGGMEDLGSPVKISSASKFEYQHFLGLQAIYNFPKKGSTLPAAITSQFPSDSGCDLENVPGYTAYLNEIEKAAVNGISEDSAAQTRTSRSLNAFINVWQLHMHVLVGDEQAADLLKVSQVSPASPVAKRTRAKIRARQLEQAPATPTPAPRSRSTFLAMQTANLSLNDDVGFESDGDPEKDRMDDESAEDTGNLSDDDVDENDEDSGMYVPRIIFTLLEQYLRVIICLDSSDSTSAAKCAWMSDHIAIILTFIPPKNRMKTQAIDLTPQH